MSLHKHRSLFGGAALLALGSLASPSLAAPQSGAEQLRLEPSPMAQAFSASPQIAQTYVPGVGNVGDDTFQQARGWYLTLGAGASRPSNNTWTLDDLDVFGIDSASATARYGGGFSIDGGIGYDFGAIRTELTYAYNRASLNKVSGHAGGFDFASSDVSGVVNKSDVLASAYVDFPFGRWVPYIGGGIGYTNLSTPSITLLDQRSGSASRGVFGWQAKAGIAYGIDYNWDIYAEGVYQGAGGFDDGDLHVSSFNNWGGKLGFRYRFGRPAAVAVEQPAPAPAPQPAPAPAPEPAPFYQPAPPVRGLW